MKLDVFFTKPVIASVLLHVLLLIVMISNWSNPTPEQERTPPHIVQATLVDLHPKAIAAPQQPKPQVLEAQKKIELERKQQQEREKQQAAADAKKIADQKRAEQQKAEQAKKLEQAKLEQLKVTEAKRKAEQQKKAEQDKQAKAKAEAAKKEAQAKSEAERKKREQAQKEEAARKEAAIQKEQQHLSERSDSVNTQSWEGLIREQLIENWSRPPGTRNGIKVVVQVNMVPTGQVINVRVIESSGDAAFDRSAEQAVKRVGQFQGIKEMPNDVFERHFRVFNLTFQPEDLRL